jgi:hypothetical protein
LCRLQFGASTGTKRQVKYFNQAKYTECPKSRFTEKPDIKTTYLLSIVLQKFFKMFAILFDTPSATFSHAINNGGA